MGPLFRFFKAFGALGLCCMCDVVWCGGWGWGAREGMHFSQSKKARLLNFTLKRSQTDGQTHILKPLGPLQGNFFYFVYMGVMESFKPCKNHLQTLFHTHSYILYNRKRVHLNPITSQQYITLSKKLKAKPSQECEREKRMGYHKKIDEHFFQCNGI